MSLVSVLCTSLFFVVCQEESFNLLSAPGHLPGDWAYHFNQPGDEMETPSVSQQGGFEKGHISFLMTSQDPKGGK